MVLHYIDPIIRKGKQRITKKTSESNTLFFTFHPFQ